MAIAISVALFAVVLVAAYGFVRLLGWMSRQGWLTLEERTATDDDTRSWPEKMQSPFHGFRDWPHRRNAVAVVGVAVGVYVAVLGTF